MILNDVTVTVVASGGLRNVFIQGYTRARIRFTAANCTLDAGETLEGGYIIHLGRRVDANSAKMALSYPLEAGDNVITCTAISSTGAESTITKTIYAYPYDPPTATVDAFRCDSSGNANEDGAYIKVTAVESISSCGGANTATIEVKWKLRSASSYSSPITMTNGAAIIGGSLTIQDTVDILVTITDTVGNDAEYGLEILSDFWPLRFTENGKGVALLGAAPVNGELDLPAGTKIKISGRSIEWTQVWSNSAPTTSFSAQTISLDLSGYSEIKLLARMTTGTNIRTEITAELDGCEYPITIVGQTSSAAAMRFYRRGIKPSATGVTFTEAVYKNFNNTSAAVSSNTSMIPLTIWAR